ncbi:unnamed protein product [Camellia sinensis]
MMMKLNLNIWRSSEQQAAVKANDGISSTSGRKHQKKKNACEVLHGSGSSVNPKSGVGIPKDAGKRQVHTTGRSSGQWCMGPDGKGASENGLELMGKIAYRHYRKESGAGFRVLRNRTAMKKTIVTKKKAAAKKK